MHRFGSLFGKKLDSSISFLSLKMHNKHLLLMYKVFTDEFITYMYNINYLQASVMSYKHIIQKRKMIKKNRKLWTVMDLFCFLLKKSKKMYITTKKKQQQKKIHLRKLMSNLFAIFTYRKAFSVIFLQTVLPWSDCCRVFIFYNPISRWWALPVWH